MNIVLFCQHNSFIKKFNRFLLIGFAFFLLNSHAMAGNISLTWDASSSSNVGGYKLYYGKATKNYTSSIDVGNKTTYQLTGLTNGVKFFFALKTYNTAKTLESSFSNEVSATVSASTALTADFTANKTSGAPGMIVTFTPVTTGTITGWLWNFGDGGASTAQNPTHTYNVAGVYSVKLTVTGASGSATKTATNFITVANQTVPPPTANFSATTLSGNSPLSVGFTDTSTGTITSWLWGFGDGSTSTAKNPTHTYSSAGTYSVSLKVTGSNGSNTKTMAGLIIVLPPTTSSVKGLVAAYGFEETSGLIVADASDKGNLGAIKEAIRVTTGRYGKALKFDGINDWVTMKNSASLALSTGMTIEAWVKPTRTMSGWTTVVMKEQAGQQAYTLTANSSLNKPAVIPWIGGEKILTGGPKLIPGEWHHLAGTYDGQNQRLYVDGTLVATKAQSGAIKTSTGALRIGGNSIWGEFFQGYIDEVRIYNRALTSTEILKDKSTPISVSNPRKVVIGTHAIQDTVDSTAKGVAKAFKVAMPNNSGVIMDFRVYINASSTATELVAGVYDNILGHPGKLLAVGTLSAPRAGSWNTVPIPSVNLQAAKNYWIAILGTKGQLSLRHGGVTGTQVPMETSASATLTTLPKTWVTGSVNQNYGRMSICGAGYKGL